MEETEAAMEVTEEETDTEVNRDPSKTGLEDASTAGKRATWPETATNVTHH